MFPISVEFAHMFKDERHLTMVLPDGSTPVGESLYKFFPSSLFLSLPPYLALSRAHCRCLSLTSYLHTSPPSLHPCLFVSPPLDLSISPSTPSLPPSRPPVRLPSVFSLSICVPLSLCLSLSEYALGFVNGHLTCVRLSRTLSFPSNEHDSLSHSNSPYARLLWPSSPTT